MNQPESLNPASDDASALAAPPTSFGGNGTVARRVSDARAAAHGTIDKVSNVTRPAVDRLATGAHQAVDNVADATNTAAETLALKTEKLKKAHARMTGECRSYVRANPLATVGAALAAGFVLGRLLRSR